MQKYFRAKSELIKSHGLKKDEIGIIVGDMLFFMPIDEFEHDQMLNLTEEVNSAIVEKNRIEIEKLELLQKLDRRRKFPILTAIERLWKRK